MSSEPATERDAEALLQSTTSHQSSESEFSLVGSGSDDDDYMASSDVFSHPVLVKSKPNSAMTVAEVDEIMDRPLARASASGSTSPRPVAPELAPASSPHPSIQDAMDTPLERGISRPAPPSPPISRQPSSRLPLNRRTSSIIYTDEEPRVGGPLKVLDFAYPEADERHHGKGLEGQGTATPSVASEELFPESWGFGKAVTQDDEENAEEGTRLSSYSDRSDASGFKPGWYRCLYDFEPEGPEEFAMKTGDILHLIARMEQPGWALSMKDDGSTGLVPEGYMIIDKYDYEIEEEQREEREREEAAARAAGLAPTYTDEEWEAEVERTLSRGIDDRRISRELKEPEGENEGTPTTEEPTPGPFDHESPLSSASYSGTDLNGSAVGKDGDKDCSGKGKGNDSASAGAGHRAADD